MKTFLLSIFSLISSLNLWAHDIVLTISNSPYPAEIGYQLLDDQGNAYISIASNGANQSHSIVLSDGCYNLILTDSYGDGWNGATYSLTYASGGTIISGGFPNEPAFNAFEKENHFLIGEGVMGCNDPVACNYNITATCNDGSCDYISCYGCTNASACNFNELAIYDDGSCCTENCLTLELIDYVGDGWDDGVYVIENLDGEIVASGTLAYPLDYSIQHLCLPDGCYIFSVVGSAYPEEIEWTLSTDNDVINGDGLDFNETYFSLGNSACFGCTDPAACTYNPFAIFNDESCMDGPCVAYDNPWTAKVITLSTYPACSNHNGTVNGATITAVANANVTTGEDVWFRFIPSTTAARFAVNSTSFDIVLEILDEDYVSIANYDLRSGVGQEIWNFGEFVPDQIYYIGVRNKNSAAGSGNFTFCGASLKTTFVPVISSSYSLCASIKCNYTGASSYTFVLTDTEYETTHSATRIGTTKIPLINFPGIRVDQSYNVAVTANYQLTNSLGQLEYLSVGPVQSTTIVTQPPAVMSMNPAVSCSGAAIPGGAPVKFGPVICTATSHQIEFVNINGNETPIYHAVPGNIRYFRLNTVAGLVPGQSYFVRIRPGFGYEYEANWGPQGCIKYAGPSSLQAIGNNFDAFLNVSDSEDAENTPALVMEVHPNPVENGIVAIHAYSDKDRNVDVSILDLTGNVVLSRTIHISNMDTWSLELPRNIASGLYTITFESEGASSAQKLFILK